MCVCLNVGARQRDLVQFVALFFVQTRAIARALAGNVRARCSLCWSYPDSQGRRRRRASTGSQRIPSIMPALLPAEAAALTAAGDWSVCRSLEECGSCPSVVVEAPARSRCVCSSCACRCRGRRLSKSGRSIRVCLQRWRASSCRVAARSQGVDRRRLSERRQRARGPHELRAEPALCEPVWRMRAVSGARRSRTCRPLVPRAAPTAGSVRLRAPPCSGTKSASSSMPVPRSSGIAPR